MDDASRVDVEQAAQDLVDKVLHVLVCECLARADDLRQVGVHQVRHHVHVVKRVVRLGTDDVNQLEHLLLLCCCLLVCLFLSHDKTLEQTFSW